MSCEIPSRFKSGTKSGLERKHRNSGEVVNLWHSLEKCIQEKQRVKIKNLLLDLNINSLSRTSKRPKSHPEGLRNKHQEAIQRANLWKSFADQKKCREQQRSYTHLTLQGTILSNDLPLPILCH